MKLLHRSILLLILLAAVFSACKKDLGNYSYHSVDTPVPDSATFAVTYSIQQYDSLIITPNIQYKGDTSQLRYQWLVYVKSLSSPTVGPPFILATTRNVREKINIAPGNYYLELIITDQGNNMETTSRTLLNVQAAIETGWLVLHETSAGSEVDFIASKNLLPTGPEKRMANLFTANTGSPMPGHGRFIGFARRSNSGFNWITVATDQGIRRMNGFTFSQLGANDQLFRRPLADDNFQGYFSCGGVEGMVVDDNLQTLSFGFVEDAYFNAPYDGSFQLAPSIVYKEYPLYSLYAYDQLGGRFLRTGATNSTHTFTTFTPEPAAVFDPSNVGKQLLFMDYGYQGNLFAFFRDKTGSGRYLYVLNASKSDDGALAIATYDMSTLPEISNALFYQVGSLGNVALYATDKTVYRYDYSGTQKATVAFSGLPAGESITCLRIFKPLQNSGASAADFTDTNNAVVYIATWNGTQGKLYEMSMNVASGTINATPLKVYDGFGKIVDMTSKFRGTGT